MTEPQKLDNSEDLFLAELFKITENDQNDQLYKKSFYVLDEEMKDSKDQNSIKQKYDILMKKLMLDDYCQYPPRKEPKDQSLDRKQNSPHELSAVEYEIENNFLKEVQRINYLTFSPFALKFFDNSVKSNKSPEDEANLHQMLKFDYNNIVYNDELVFNICQGFVDIDKLVRGRMASKPTELNGPNCGTSLNPIDTEEIDQEKLDFYKKSLQKNISKASNPNEEEQARNKQKEFNHIEQTGTKAEINKITREYFEEFMKQKEIEDKAKKAKRDEELRISEQIERENRERYEAEEKKKESIGKLRDLKNSKANSNKDIIINNTLMSRSKSKSKSPNRTRTAKKTAQKPKGPIKMTDRTPWTSKKNDYYFNNF